MYCKNHSWLRFSKHLLVTLALILVHSIYIRQLVQASAAPLFVLMHSLTGVWLIYGNIRKLQYLLEKFGRVILWYASLGLAPLSGNPRYATVELDKNISYVCGEDSNLIKVVVTTIKCQIFFLQNRKFLLPFQREKNEL